MPVTAPHARSGEAGMSLVELLLAMVVGMVVLGAVVGLLDTAFPAQVRTAQRVDATATARGAMHVVTQRLRSQACVGSQAPVIEGTADRVRFFSGFVEPGAEGIQIRELRYDADGRAILEDVWDDPSTTIADGTATVPTTGTRRATRILASDIERPAGGVFRYYAFGSTPASPNQELTALPLARAAADSVIRIDVALTAVGSLKNPSQGTTLVNQVYLRLADPLTPGSSACG